MGIRIIFLILQLLDRGDEIYHASLKELRGGEKSFGTRLGNALLRIRNALWPWASAGSSTERQIKKRLWPRQHLSLREKFCRLLEWFGSFKASAFLLLLLIVLQLLISFSFAEPPCKAVSVSGSLLTTAEVLGGVIGIVIGVMIFGIQFHGEREGELAFLVPLFAIRIGIRPVSAIFLSILSANLIVGLFLAEYAPGSDLVLGRLDCITIPLLLFAVVWLIHESTASVGRDLLRSVYIPSLQALFERQQVAQEQGKDRNIVVSRVLNDLSIQTDQIGYMAIKFNQRFQTSTWKLPAPIIDVNLTCLRQIVAANKKSLNPDSFVLGLTVGSKEILIAASRSDQSCDMPGNLAEQFSKALLTSNEWMQIEDQFQRLDSHLASNDCATSDRQFFTCIELVDWCMESELQSAGTVGFRTYEHLSALVANAWYTSGTNRLDSLFDWACRISLAETDTAPFGRIVIESIFRRHSRTPDRYPQFEGKLDDFLGILFSRSRALFDGYESGQGYSYGLHRVRIRFGLNLVKTAMEFKRTVCLNTLLDRLFCDARFQFSRQSGRMSNQLLNDIADLNSAAAFCTVGWAYHLVGQNSYKLEELGSVISWARGYFQNQLQCHELWHKINKHIQYGLDYYLEELCCQSWRSSLIPRRTMVVYDIEDAENWFKRGFIAMGLTLPFSEGDLGRIENGHRACLDLSSNNVPYEVDRLAELGWFTAEQLEITQVEQDTRKTKFLQLLSKSNEVFRNKEFLGVLNDPFDPKLVQEFVLDVSSAFSDLPCPFNLIRENSSGLATTQRIHFSQEIPRQHFLKSGSPIEVLMNVFKNLADSYVQDWVCESVRKRATSDAIVNVSDLKSTMMARLSDQNQKSIALVVGNETHSNLLNDDTLSDAIERAGVKVIVSANLRGSELYLFDPNECFVLADQKRAIEVHVVDLTEIAKSNLRVSVAQARTTPRPTTDIKIQVNVSFDCPIIESRGRITRLRLQ